MHQIYTTSGFILKSLNFSEANKVFFIFTADFGLVRVVAQGSRLAKSKLRYHLSDFSWGNFGLVRGREVWRLVSAETTASTHTFISNDRESFLLWARLSRLLLRLLQGEERNSGLFDTWRSGWDFFISHHLTPPAKKDFECLLVLKILADLGYLADPVWAKEFISVKQISDSLLARLSKKRRLAILEINKSLHASQL